MSTKEHRDIKNVPASSATANDDDGNSLRKINAIIRATALERVEERLQAIRIPGISVTHVKGYGEYANFFRRDPTVGHARIEIFCRQKCVETIVQTILDAAHTGVPGDGIVAVLPVEIMYRVRTREVAAPDDIGDCSFPAEGGWHRPDMEESHEPVSR